MFQHRRRPRDPGGAPRPTAPADLIGDVHALRLTLTTDLTIAAAALDADAPQIAADVVEHERVEVAAFERRALAHLSELEAARAVVGVHPPVVVPLARSPRWRSLPAASLAAAAAAVAGLLSLAAAPAPAGDGPTVRVAQTQPLHESYADYRSLATRGAAAHEVLAAADALHRSLAPLIARAATDPAAARQVLQVLQLEQQLLLDARPPGMAELLDQARRLVARVTAVLPVTLPRVAVPAASSSDDGRFKREQRRSQDPQRAQAQPEPSPASDPQQRPAATPSATPTDAPSATPTDRPSPDPTPTSSGSPEPGVGLPQGPGLGGLGGLGGFGGAVP